MILDGLNFSGGFRILPPPPATNIPVQSGLVMQLDATNNLSYPGTGTTVTDLTGGFNHTLTDANMFVDSGGIKYFQFDAGGTSKKMNVNGTGPTMGAGGNGFTYVVWAMLQSSVSSNRFLMNGAGGLPRWFVDSNNGNYRVWNNGSSVSVLGGSYSGIVDLWTQLTYTVDAGGTTCALFVNTTSSGSVFSGNGFSGRAHVGFGNYANWGRVAICCLYNRVLTSTEISTNYNGLKGFFGL